MERVAAIGLAIVLAVGALFAQTNQKPAAKPQTIVFVCEHGAAKSVIAAAYFNKLAAERHLNAHAVARGTDPQAELSDSTVAGLKKDGVAFPSDKPRGLTEADIRGADRVVAFCPVPERLGGTKKTQTYDVPAPKDGYDASRDAILRHVRELVDQLEADSKRR